MVVWEDGRMKKSDYRKFIIRTVEGNDDFARMREVVTRRYCAAAGGEASDARPGADRWRPRPACTPPPRRSKRSGSSNQPLASIAKREEMIYVYGQEDEPVSLDRFSPVLHLVQTIRDEAHRFAVTFHRDAPQRRAADDGTFADRRCG